MTYHPRPLFRHRFVPASCALPRGERLAAPAASFRLPALVRLWVWVILALALPAVAADLALPTVPKKPNILFLLADDLRPDGIGALGNPFVDPYGAWA